jgi:hypothetical protein
MSVESTERRVQFVGDGATVSFPFSFKVFTPTDVAVFASGSAGEEKLTYGTDFTVSLNDDQGESPGGTVTVKNAVTTGAVLAITSEVPYDQPMHVTPYGGFNPETLNDNSDRQCIQIQQLLEKVGRAITTDPTDTVTPAELKQKLLGAANTATIVAKGYAEAAAASAADAKQSRDDILDHKQGIVDAVTAEGDKQNQRLVTEGDTQIGRIKAETDNTLIANGMGCAERFWTLSADTPAGTDITIPSGIKYLVNRHHLRVAWNGLVLAIGQNFTEVGAQDTFSTTFRLTFDAKAGDEIDVWIGALGKGDVAEALALAGEASAAVAELSRKVVYKEEV